MSPWLDAGVAPIWRTAITAITVAAALADVARLLQFRMGVSSLRLLSNPACPAGAAVILYDANTVATDAAPHGDIELQTAGHFCTVISPAIAYR